MKFKNTTHHYAQLVGALRLFICNVPLMGDNDTRRVFIMSVLLHTLVLVAVIAEHQQSCCVNCTFKATVIC